MNGLRLLDRRWRRVGAAVLFLAVTPAVAPVTRAQQAAADRPMLTARMSRWQGDPAKKKKGPPGFDIQFRLVGARFDGTFGVEGVPQSVPQGEPFDAQIKLTNIGTGHIKLSSVTVTGELTFGMVTRCPPEALIDPPWSLSVRSTLVLA